MEHETLTQTDIKNLRELLLIKNGSSQNQLFTGIMISLKQSEQCLNL